MSPLLQSLLSVSEGLHGHCTVCKVLFISGWRSVCHFSLKIVDHFVVFSFVVNDEFDFEYLDHMVYSMCPPVETDKLDDSR